MSLPLPCYDSYGVQQSVTQNVGGNGIATGLMSNQFQYQCGLGSQKNHLDSLQNNEVFVMGDHNVHTWSFKQSQMW